MEFKHDNPDIVVCYRQEFIYSVIKYSCPIDVIVSLKLKEKEDSYGHVL